MIISAQFKSKKTDTYTGRKYSYFCNLPGVKPGKFVKVPAGDTESVALVAEINVPESRVEDRILAVMKSVIAIVEESAPEQEATHEVP